MSKKPSTMKESHTADKELAAKQAATEEDSPAAGSAETSGVQKPATKKPDTKKPATKKPATKEGSLAPGVSNHVAAAAATSASEDDEEDEADEETNEELRKASDAQENEEKDVSELTSTKETDKAAPAKPVHKGRIESEEKKLGRNIDSERGELAEKVAGVRQVEVQVLYHCTVFKNSIVEDGKLEGHMPDDATYDKELMSPEITGCFFCIQHTAYAEQRGLDSKLPDITQYPRKVPYGELVDRVQVPIHHFHNRQLRFVSYGPSGSGNTMQALFALLTDDQAEDELYSQFIPVSDRSLGLFKEGGMWHCVMYDGKKENGGTNVIYNIFVPGDVPIDTTYAWDQVYSKGKPAKGKSKR